MPKTFFFSGLRMQEAISNTFIIIRLATLMGYDSATEMFVDVLFCSPVLVRVCVCACSCPGGKKVVSVFALALVPP